MNQQEFLAEIVWHTTAWSAAALIGPFAFAYVALIAESVLAKVDQMRYTFNYANAIVFASFSKIQNFIYGRTVEKSLLIEYVDLNVLLNCPLVVQEENSRTAILIPGTWSRRGYNWGRWKSLCDELAGRGYRIYGINWHSSNDEKTRNEVVRDLSDWLTKGRLEPESVDIVGHSYGGHVAALISNHPAVRRIVTIATPFPSAIELTEAEVASSAQGRYSMLFGVVFTIYLSGVALCSVLFSDADTWAALLARVISCLIALFVGILLLRRVLRQARSAGGITGMHDALLDQSKIDAIRVRHDEILDEMIDASAGAEHIPRMSPQFADQSSISQMRFREWIDPYIGTAALMQTIWLTLVCWGYLGRTHGLRAFDCGLILGALYFAIHLSFLCRTASDSEQPRFKLALDFCNLVDRTAVIAENRRRVVAWLAGFPSSIGLLRWVRIAAVPDPQVREIEVTLQSDSGSAAPAKRKLVAFRHSKAVGDPNVLDAVLQVLGVGRKHLTLQ